MVQNIDTINHISSKEILKISIPLLIIYAAIGQSNIGFIVLSTIGVQQPFLDVAQHLYQFFFATLLLLVIPWILLKKKTPNYRIISGTTKGNCNFGKWLLLISPLAILALWIGSNDPALIDEYPLSKETLVSWEYFILFEIAYGLFYYIPYEFHFRGFLQTGLSQSWSAWQSILFVTLVTTALHWMKPISEIMGALAVGFFFGYLAYKTKSWGYVWWIHYLVGLSTDTFCALRFLGII